MGEFNEREWFRNQYLKEGHTEDKTRELDDIKKLRQLEKEPQWEKDKETLSDLVALMKKHGMMDEEKSLKEDDLNEISRDTYDRMEASADQRELNELKDLIMILGGEWSNKGFENKDIVDYFEALVYQLVRM